jgi:hypothetical protein
MTGARLPAWFAAWADGFSAGFGADGARAAPIVRVRRDGFRWTTADGGSQHMAFGATSGQGGRVRLRLCDGLGMIRPLITPDTRNRAETARLNLTRLAPLPPAEIAWALGPASPVDGELISPVHIAPRAELQRIVSAATAAGWTVTAVDVEDPTAPDAAAEVNLLDAATASRAPAWVLASAVALLLGGAAWGGFGPAAPGAAARSLAAEIATRPSVSAQLGAAAGALPDDVVLTAFALKDGKVRLEGEAADPALVIDVINSAGPFRNAALIGAPERPPGATRARFVLTAVLK